jgi:hypothetical protein
VRNEAEVSVHAGSRLVSTEGLRAAVSRLRAVWPVLITAGVLFFMVGVQLSAAHGNPSTFVKFGRPESRYLHPPAGAPISSTIGYDGQIYWLQATDPLLRNPATLADFARGWGAYHLQRPVYPALAWLLAGGRRALLPWSLLAINVACVLAITAAFAVYCRRRGWNPWWALAVGLAPGVLLPVLADLSDVLATSLLLAGMICWERGRSWWSALLLAAAALTREPMILAVPAIAAETSWRAWQARGHRPQLGALAARAWPAIVVPLLAFFGWRAYVSTLHSATVRGHSVAVVTGSTTTVVPHFANFVQAARSAIDGGALRASWILAYLGLTAAAMLWSVAMLARGRSAAAFLAPLLSLTLGFTFLGDQWALTRYTAPLFCMLLLVGLERRSRVSLALSAGAAVMTLLLPML